MNTKIVNITKIMLVTGALLGAASIAGAASVVGTGVGSVGSVGTVGTSGVGEVTSTTGATTTGTTTGGCATTASPSGTWAAPTSAPTAGNVAAPVNIGAGDQYKPGKLTLGPCPIAGTVPSKLSVNGITDTTGFANWGAEFIQGFTTIGASWVAPRFASTSPQPKLYVKADSPSQFAGVFGGGVAVLGNIGITQPDGSTLNPDVGGYTLFVQGQRVCLQDGTDCPTVTSTKTVAGLTGSGTTNHLAKWSGSGLADSSVVEGGESHFWNGTYTDPEPGTATAIKATSIASGSMFVAGSTTTTNLYVGGLTPGTPAVLFSTGDGHAVWKAVKPVLYGCNGVKDINNLDDGRMLVMPDGDTSHGTSAHCIGPNLGGGLGVFGYLLVP